MADSFNACVKASESKAWKLDEILPPQSKLDLSKQFIALNRDIVELTHLSPAQILLLSQILASCYTYIIHIVEEFIVQQTVSEVSKIEMHSERLRALSRFIDEEVKHQLLFSRFNDILQTELNQKIIMPNTGQEFAKKINSYNPLAVWLLTLHTEIMTQTHYTTLFQSNQQLDQTFVEILKFHWYEEAIHVRIDSLEVEHLNNTKDKSFISQGCDDYFTLLKLVDEELFKSAVAVVENYFRIAGGQGIKNKDSFTQYILSLLRNFLIYEGARHPTMIRTAESLNTGMEKQIKIVPKIISEIRRAS